MLQLDTPLAEPLPTSEEPIHPLYAIVMQVLGDPEGWEEDTGPDLYWYLPCQEHLRVGGRYVHSNGSRMYVLGESNNAWSLYIYQPKLVICPVSNQPMLVKCSTSNQLQQRYFNVPDYVGELPRFGDRLDVATLRRALYWCSSGQDHMDSIKSMVWGHMLDMLPDCRFSHWRVFRTRDRTWDALKCVLANDCDPNEPKPISFFAEHHISIPQDHPMVVALEQLGFWEAYVARTPQKYLPYDRFRPNSEIMLEFAISAHGRAQQFRYKASQKGVLALPDWAQPI